MPFQPEDRMLDLMLQQLESRRAAGRHGSHRHGDTLAILLLVLLVLTVDARTASSQQTPREPSPTSQTPSTQPLSVRGKLRFYLDKNFGPAGLLRSAFSAGLNQWRDYPTEWGQGAEGYGRRLASCLGQNTVKNTIRFVTATALREDPRYFPSEQKGFSRRVGHALASVFVTRTDSGGRRFAVSEFAGVVGSKFIANQWYPPRVATTNDALRGSAVTLGYDAAWNLAKEFWPDIKKALRHR